MKIGKHQQSDGTTTGMHSLRKSNARGEMMVQFTTPKHLTITNTLFKKSKKRKWTWLSPNGEVMNEIDYILTNKREIMLNTKVIQRVNIRNDQKMVRSTIRLNTHMERSRMRRSSAPKTNIEALLQRSEEFHIELRNRFSILGNDIEDTNESAKQLSNTIYECSEKVVGKVKNRKEEKLKPKTKAILNKQ